jgi:hypothetical protein
MTVLNGLNIEPTDLQGVLVKRHELKLTRQILVFYREIGRAHLIAEYRLQLVRRRRPTVPWIWSQWK